MAPGRVCYFQTKPVWWQTHRRTANPPRAWDYSTSIVWNTTLAMRRFDLSTCWIASSCPGNFGCLFESGLVNVSLNSSGWNHWMLCFLGLGIGGGSWRCWFLVDWSLIVDRSIDWWRKVRNFMRDRAFCHCPSSATDPCKVQGAKIASEQHSITRWFVVSHSLFLSISVRLW